MMMLTTAITTTATTAVAMYHGLFDEPRRCCGCCTGYCVGPGPADITGTGVGVLGGPCTRCGPLFGNGFCAGVAPVGGGGGGGGFGGGGGGGSRQQAAPASNAPADDPWGSAPASGSFAGGDDEPPF
jgi:hypothetical protein